MQVDKSDEIAVLTPAELAGQLRIRAGFTMRHGGVSSGPYRSLNLGLSTDDASENVLENRRRLFARLGLSADHLAIAGQVHGSDVNTIRKPGLYRGYDALVTDAENLILCITAADCAVVLLADSEAGVVAACHSGWRGTVAGIAPRTVESMQDHGARPERVTAYVSPCISVENFEVGPEVATQFDTSYVVSGYDKPHIDLKAAIRDQLIAAGLPEHGVEVSNRCTFAETGDFFSYRSEGTTGRMMGFICLTDA